MAKDPAFLFYPGDYLRDTQTLSENSQVSYDRIMCEHMRNICITQQQLKFFTKRLNENEIEELMFVLTKIRGGFQIEWVAESIDKRKRYSKSRSDNRRGKKEDMINISKTYDEHMENENVIENKDEKENVIEVADKIKMAFGKNWYGDNWTIWLNYKKDEFNFKYKSKQSEICAFEKLLKISKGSSVIALRIIHESIANGWKGFFNLTNEDNGRGNNIETVKKYIDIISEQGN